MTQTVPKILCAFNGGAIDTDQKCGIHQRTGFSLFAK